MLEPMKTLSIQALAQLTKGEQRAYYHHFKMKLKGMLMEASTYHENFRTMSWRWRYLN
jgi:hypothetical protein